jgi:UDP-N-acetylglucosamine 2-epimerase (non-hydrolysing)
MPPKRVVCVIGTRPEAIKMAPVIQALRGQSWAEVCVVATAQHRQMLDQALEIFGIRPDLDLNLMRPKQRLSDLTARTVRSLDRALGHLGAACVLAQGDTTTVMATALSCFYRGLPFFHVEAGLRTGLRQSPFPEEMNRALIGRLAWVHFAPTEGARRSLLREGIEDQDIHVTGNTVIDALLRVAREDRALDLPLDPTRRLLLVTAHRRENFGSPLRAICSALRRIAARRDVQVLFPVHPNPNVAETVQRELGGCPGILLTPPLSYETFVGAMKRAYLVLTDSGGIQEEAPALGKPVLVLRRETERPEAVAAGVVRVVGPDTHRIVEAAGQLLDDPQAYRAMARGVSPYGDGQAAARIARVVQSFFEGRASSMPTEPPLLSTAGA